MQTNPIQSDVEYKDALSEIELLMGAEADTAAGDRLEVLVNLVQAWEQREAAELTADAQALGLGY